MDKPTFNAEFTEGVGLELAMTLPHDALLVIGVVAAIWLLWRVGDD